MNLDSDVKSWRVPFVKAITCNIGVAIFALLTMTAEAQAVIVETPGITIPPEWRICRSDDQCVVMHDGCGDWAVNKEYFGEAGKLNIDCTKSGLHSRDSIPRCVNDKCAVEFP
jgi:hypothetical protein